MSPATIRVTFLAVLVGLGGAYGVRSYLASKTPPKKEAETITVPLAAMDIPAGRTVRLGDIALTPMTRAQLRKISPKTGYVMMDPQQIIGRTLRTPLKRGEPFLTTNMYPEGLGPDVVSMLEPGYRAVTLRMEDPGDYTLLPGCMVDVLFRHDPKPGSSSAALPEMTITLLQGVKVLSVRRLGSDPLPAGQVQGVAPAPSDDPVLVTLAVTLEQASVLHHVQGRGELRLVPRAANDVDISGYQKKVTLEDILDLGRPSPLSMFRTDIYRGTQLETKVFNGLGQLVQQTVNNPPAAPAIQSGAAGAGGGGGGGGGGG